MKFCITLVTLFFLFVFPINGVQSQSYEVDVAMVLAVDVSSSVSEEHWELQREGLANAIESNEFFNSVRSGFEGKVAIAVVEWSSSSYLVINWTVVESRNDLQQLAIKIRALNRVENLGTCMAKALLKSAQLLEQWDGRAMKRLIDYLLWMHINLNDQSILTFDAMYIFDSLFMIILQDHVGKIVKYCTHLEKDRELAPQTIKNTLYDIKSCSYWYLVIFQKTPNVVDIWLPLDNLIAKCCLKENRRDRQIKSTGKSMETVIADRRWPVNGLKELQQTCVHEIIKYTDMNKATFIDERFYNEFMKLLYATYYVFNVQGRVGAFTTLTYDQGGEMVNTVTILMTFICM